MRMLFSCCWMFAFGYLFLCNLMMNEIISKFKKKKEKLVWFFKLLIQFQTPNIHLVIIIIHYYQQINDNISYKFVFPPPPIYWPSSILLINRINHCPGTIKYNFDCYIILVWYWSYQFSFSISFCCCWCWCFFDSDK